MGRKEAWAAAAALGLLAAAGLAVVGSASAAAPVGDVASGAGKTCPYKALKAIGVEGVESSHANADEEDHCSDAHEELPDDLKYEIAVLLNGEAEDLETTTSEESFPMRRDYRPEATCSDFVQNQQEEGIDCGGPCPKACVGASTVCDVYADAFDVSPETLLTTLVTEIAGRLLGSPLLRPYFDGSGAGRPGVGHPATDFINDVPARMQLVRRLVSFFGAPFLFGCCQSPDRRNDQEKCFFPAYAGALNMKEFHRAMVIGPEEFGTFLNATLDVLERAGMSDAHLMGVRRSIEWFEPDVCNAPGCSTVTEGVDCRGVPNGSSFVDSCGVCGGDDTSCLDCSTDASAGNAKCYFPFLFDPVTGKRRYSSPFDTKCRRCGKH